ncbi:Ig domain-containing protein [Candidatus Omnitrophota bacterium]
MKKVALGLVFLFSIMLVSAVSADDYLILHEPGYIQEVIADDLTPPPSDNNKIRSETTTCLDWEGNLYFIGEGDTYQRRIIKKVTPEGIVTDFATLIEIPDHNNCINHISMSVYGELYVVLQSVRDEGFLQPFIKVSGFKPLNEVFMPPELASIDNKRVYANRALEFQLEASDPDSPELVYCAENLPFGAIFNPDTQIFRWTPHPSQVGEHQNVRFQVTDGLLYDYEAITITVLPKPRIQQYNIHRPIGNGEI